VNAAEGRPVAGIEPIGPNPAQLLDGFALLRKKRSMRQ